MIRRAQVVLGLAALVGAAFAASSAGQGPPGGSPPGLDKAIAAKQKHAERLLDQPGVAGIGVGLNPAGKPVILIYKEKPDVPDVPDELEGVPVESTTTGMLEPRDHSPQHRFPRPIPIGVSSGLAGVATGTLGARVTDGTRTFALSNNHVFAGVNTAAVGDAIIHPGDVDGGSDPSDRIGTLYAYETIDFDGSLNTMDAAIALTSAADVGTGTPADGYGAPSPVTATASIGLPVQKYGRTTGFQLGNVVATDLSVDVCYIALANFCLQEARFAGQISISPGPFSAPGDSGSLIVTQSGNQPVALLFAGGDGLTIGSPIDLVLQRFGVTIEGTPPQDGPPGAPVGLSATPGDTTASLTWSAPNFDGGSPVSGYRVYRGTSAGGETFYQALGNVTSFDDTGLTNGTTYHYRVSAENDNGEGTLSSGVSATPTALVAPVEPLPVVDAFDRGFENPLSDTGRWSNGVGGSPETGLYVPSTWLACSKSTTCTSWRNATQYGPDVEVWARIGTLAGDNNHIRLKARLQGVGTSTYDGYMLRTNQLPGTDQIWVERVDNGVFVNRLTLNQELAVGDTLLLRVKGSTLEVWRHRSSAWSRLGVVTDTTYGAAGYTGIGLRGTTGRLDDFGARSLSQSAPGAPTGLSATPGNTTASLTWSAPNFDGGSPVTGYRVYRGTSAGGETFHQSLGNVTSFVDTGLTNGTTYYYKVSAESANGEGALSNGATVTPGAVTAPDEPLPVVDDFDRGFENPLSDAGRWSNGVNGAGETGLYVPSTWLACSRSTTCTSWRNAAQYGPDVEVWARIGTLPGDNNHIRLKARLQGVGTSTYDGYMLRTNQLPGTDQIWVERIDNGVFVNRLTINQELTVGDTLLLRVEGSTLEVWRHRSSAWSRLGVVTDATYGGAGRVGVGLRGTIGRLDDFGARTIGAPPPDTEPPSAPGTLTATAFSSSQIELSWQPATDNGAVTLYRIERCEGAGCSDFDEIAMATSTSHMDTSLSPSTDYSYRVRAEDAVPNVGDYSNTASAMTLTPPDTEPPSAPGTLSASATSPSQIDLSWGAASDNVAVTLYRIERCEGAGCSTFDEIATTSSTSYPNTGLSASTEYSYRVRAQDAVPNVGDYSNTASATTLTPPDTEQPSAPDTLSATATSPSQIDLSWGAASDNVAVTLYRIERCEGSGCSNFAEIATTSSTTYPNTGLSASTEYAYRVRAQDAVPNVGDYSNTASATTLTPPDTEPPSAPGTLTASASSATQIDLSWGAATDNVAVGQYRIERCSGPSCGNFAEIATTTATSYSDPGLSASTPYSYRVRAEDTATPTANSGLYSNLAFATTSAPARPMYFSLESNGTVGGVSAANEDVVFFDGVSTFSLVFDGSDVGLSSRRLDAFTWLDTNSLLFSLDTDGATLPGVTGTIDESDVVRFDASALGPTTSGTFSMYFDGSDVGLTVAGEDVDAFEVLADGRLVLSTVDSASVPGVSGADEDLLVFTQTSLGATTSGSYALYFDGSDVGLTTTNEDVDAAAVDAAGRIYLSTLGAFSVTGTGGSDEDVFVFNPTSLGANTAGSYDSALYFDGSAFGLSSNDVFAIDLP